MRGEDAQKRLDALFDPLNTAEALTHPCSDPWWDWLALLLTASTLGGDTLLLMHRRSA
jgi:hypothetical protein